MKKIFLLSVTFCLILSHLHAQEFSTGIQLRPRFEYRNGFKTLLGNEQEAKAFISQRSRLNLLYQEEKISVKLAFQNVRTWGDVPTVIGREAGTGFTNLRQLLFFFNWKMDGRFFSLRSNRREE